jgi:ferredoxin
MDLTKFDTQWPAAIAAILPEAIEADALLIWLQLYPLSLFQLAKQETDRADFERYYQLRGRYRLSEIADTSSSFLPGHRHWPAVKAALPASPGDDLAALIRQIAGGDPAKLAIAAVLLMTLRQAGPAFLQSGYQPPAPPPPPGLWQRLTSRGLKVTMQDGNSFPILPGQHITTGAELDKRPYHTTDERCYQGMGPIPVDCRSGSCGTCWVGILEGKDQTDPVSDFEQKRMQYFGYWENPFHDPAAERPLIRLACQTIVRGSCRIIIPTWNGVLGSARQSRRLER